MKQTLPGILAERAPAKAAPAPAVYLETLFSAGGLVLSQVVELTGQTAHTIQNWVKRGFVSPPVGKKYSREQLCTILLLGMYHEVLYLGDIPRMVAAMGGPDESRGAAELIYVSLAQTLALLPENALAANTHLDKIVGGVVDGKVLRKTEKDKLKKILYALVMARLSQRALSIANHALEAL